MSATHIGIASAAVIPESLAIMSHFDACVPRRSITRSKSNIGTVAPAVACGRQRWIKSAQHEMRYPSNTASAPFTASALSVTVFSSDAACTVMFSAKNRATVT